MDGIGEQLAGDAFENLGLDEQNKRLAEEFSNFFVESEIIDIVLEDSDE